MRAFTFVYTDGRHRVGLDYDGNMLDFTKVWDYYKDATGQGRGIDFSFLQVIVELDIFHAANLEEVVNQVLQFRGIETLKPDGDFSFTVPIARPQKIICLGWAGDEHEPSADIYHYAKLPSCLTAHQSVVQFPDQADRLNARLEVAVVIGKLLARADTRTVSESVAGYMNMINLWAPDMLENDRKQGRPWLRAHSFDGACAVGPFLNPADALPRPDRITFQLSNGGQETNSFSYDDYGLDHFEQIAALSRLMTLHPGDIVALGAPGQGLLIEGPANLSGDGDDLGTIEVRLGG